MPVDPLHSRHERRFEANRFVYPVISRRSGGLSIGVNLNPDKVCNFDCVYCQVDRTRRGETRFVETGALLAELDGMLRSVASGGLFETEKFRGTPGPLRRLRDIAFSGDGEPTVHENFDAVVAACADVKRQHGLAEVKMVLITNASLLDRPHVRRGLEILDANAGEIWAKLDCGTDEHYRRVARTAVPFEQILENITTAAKARPLVIQSLFMRLDGRPPADAELAAYCDRLSEIVAAGGSLKLVQVHTVARRPAEPGVEPLSDAEVDEIARMVTRQTGLPAAAYHGSPRE